MGKKRGNSRGIILKINLKKAYDRISWNFLEKVLINFNFSNNIIKLILSCVTKGETNILSE